MNLKNQVSLQTESDIFYIFRIQKTREENQNEYMSSIHGISEIYGFWMPISNFVNNVDIDKTKKKKNQM